MKRYRAFSDELKRLFGCKVYRVSLDAGFSCPNRDGTLSVNGCIFCGAGGSGSHGIAGCSVTEQLAHGKAVVSRKYKAHKFLAYFQAFSNTYAPIAHLRELYDEALAEDDVVGIIVGTRPDCLSEEVLDLLEEYAARTYLWVELGMQSSHDRSLEIIRRGHDAAATTAAIRNCRRRGLRVCCHAILGLPGETRDDMLRTADFLAAEGADGVKIHLLHVVKETALEDMYRRGDVPLLAMEEYVSLACDFLERLPESVLVHRVTGEAGRNYLVAPLWALRKLEVINAIDAELERRGTAQGAASGQKG